MNDFKLRPWRREDMPRLATLWHDAFGDDEDYIETFNSMFLLKPGGCIVAETAGKLVSAMYIMDGPKLCLPGGERLSSAYTYALATDPAWRGRGIGTAVYKACVTTALERADAAFVLPAESELYPFYEKAAGCATLGAVREAHLTPDAFDGLAKTPLELLLPEEYELRRESIMSQKPHGVMTDDFVVLQAYHMARFGGGFFAAGSAVATVEMAGDICRVVELLAPDGDGMAALAAIADAFPAKNYLVRSPVFMDGPGSLRPFQLAALRPGLTPSLFDGFWWGFAFD